MRILLANELGSGTGHLHTAATLGAALADQGHDVAHAVRDLVAAQRHGVLARRPLLQAPRPPRGTARGGGLARDYAALLQQAGYDDVDTVTGLLCAWRGLFEATDATAVIAEHAPLALIAARAHGLPAVALGTGFSVPPGVTPLVPMDPGTGRDSTETRLLAVISEALGRLGQPPLHTLAALFATDRTRLLSLPAFDHYGMREANVCVGLLPAAEPAERTSAAFPDGDGPKTLACRHADYGGFEELAHLLAATGAPSVLVAPGLDARRAEELCGDQLHVVPGQVDLQAMLSEADRAIVHGGHGTTARVVLAGLPCLVLPWFLEQALLGRRLEAAGLARVATHVPSVTELEGLFASQEDEGPRRARAAFSNAHATSGGIVDLPSLTAWLEARLEAPGPRG